MKRRKKRAHSKMMMNKRHKHIRRLKLIIYPKHPKRNRNLWIAIRKYDEVWNNAEN